MRPTMFEAGMFEAGMFEAGMHQRGMLETGGRRGGEGLRRPSVASGLLVALVLVLAGTPAGAVDPDARWPLDALSTAVRSNAEQDGTAPVTPTVSSFTGETVRHLTTALPGTLEHSHFDGGLDPHQHPWFAARSLLPVARMQDGALLTQGGATRGQDGLDGDMGLGLRRLFEEDQLLAGASAFLDGGGSSRRAYGSFGSQLETAPFGMRVNVYRPYGDAPPDPAGGTAAGYDMKLRLQLPYLPLASASFEDSSRMLGPDDKAAPARRVGLSFQPLPYLNLDGKMGRTEAQAASYSVGLHLTLKLDGSNPRTDSQLIDDRPFHFESMRDHLLDLIPTDDTRAPAGGVR